MRWRPKSSVILKLYKEMMGDKQIIGFGSPLLDSTSGEYTNQIQVEIDCHAANETASPCPS